MMKMQKAWAEFAVNTESALDSAAGWGDAYYDSGDK